MKKRIASKPLRNNPRVRANTKNLIGSLFTYGSVETGLNSAKAVSRIIDKMITSARKLDLSALRLLIKKTGKATVGTSMFEYAKQVAGKRTSGFISVKRSGARRGDNTVLGRMTLLDFAGKLAVVKAPSSKKTETVKEKVATAKKVTEKPVKAVAKKSKAVKK